MESPVESMSWTEWARSVEPWVLPAIAAVVVAGALLLCALIGMFWLASRPARQPIVVWMQPTAAQAEEPASSPAGQTNLPVENRVNVRAN